VNYDDTLQDKVTGIYVKYLKKKPKRVNDI